MISLFTGSQFSSSGNPTRLGVGDEPRMEMSVPERVMPLGLEHRPTHGPLVRVPTSLGDPTGRVMPDGVVQLQPVEAEFGEGPAGENLEGPGGDRS
ncbi:hypothetical protein SGFS_054370 [Streptomyces graminofaciens]|uniref:Uncharacterized protein n=1 Tax=Streptomyces graminofaciens TaxID=68212 RepID=A0ABM7FCV5_9ACTN|nr:hypothetical protein SGFS_054370 [Streptomyces graminofaciens]